MLDAIEPKDVVIKKKQLTDFSINIYANDIIEIVWSTELKQIEKSHVVDVALLIQEIGQGKKMLVYFSTHDLLTISKEARKFGGSSQAQANTLANAVLTNSLATKLIFNFFMRVNRPKTPTKSFSSRDEAFAWLVQKKLENDFDFKVN